MAASPVVSIIIDNYNYEQFLGEAIDSALRQTYRPTEVIVVDDGSTDGSRTLLERYRDRVWAVLKPNGGQSSAFNAGFRVSRGDVLCFLDADDRLHPRALERAVPHFRKPAVAKVHWPMWVIDKSGRKTGDLLPVGPLGQGDLRDSVLNEGPGHYTSSPSSANAYARAFLDRVFPLPEIDKQFNVGAADLDDYLSMLAPLFGLVGKVDTPSGYYRIHGRSDYSCKSFEEKLQRELLLSEHRCACLARYCRKMGLKARPRAWQKNYYYYRLRQATQEIKAVIPPGNTLILVDQHEWATDQTFLGCHRIAFDSPANGCSAIRAFRRLRACGASHLVFAWPAFWWFAYYSEFDRYLRSTYPAVLENERVVIFDLRGRSNGRA
jgi:glycosyltransferase involved in cell wall biosynthesis